MKATKKIIFPNLILMLYPILFTGCMGTDNKQNPINNNTYTAHSDIATNNNNVANKLLSKNIETEFNHEKENLYLNSNESDSNNNNDSSNNNNDSGNNILQTTKQNTSIITKHNIPPVLSDSISTHTTTDTNINSNAITATTSQTLINNNQQHELQTPGNPSYLGSYTINSNNINSLDDFNIYKKNSSIFDKLIISNLSINNHIEKIKTFIQKFPKLTFLNLSNVDISANNLYDILTTTQINELHLSNSPITQENLETMAYSHTLINLKIDNNHITKNIINRITNISTLQTLSLSGCQIDSSILTKLTNLSQLIFLNLSNTNITATDLEDLREALTKSQSHTNLITIVHSIKNFNPHILINSYNNTGFNNHSIPNKLIKFVYIPSYLNSNNSL